MTSLVEWLIERYKNCIAIADYKSGDDREGWIEDSKYFERAIKAARFAENHGFRP